MAVEGLAVWMWLVAASGPNSAFVEGLATSVGAGAFLGGFVASAAGLILRRTQAWRDKAVAVGTCCGGLAMAMLALLESIR